VIAGAMRRAHVRAYPRHVVPPERPSWMLRDAIVADRSSA
jgi:hypothetical protein